MLIIVYLLMLLLMLALVAYPFWTPLLLKKMWKKKDFKMKFNGYTNIPYLHMKISTIVHPAWDQFWLFVTGIRISRERYK